MTTRTYQTSKRSIRRSRRLARLADQQAVARFANTNILFAYAA